MAKFKDYLKFRYTGAEKVSKNPLDPASRFVGVNSVYTAMTPGEPEYNSDEGESVRRTLGDIVREAAQEVKVLGAKKPKPPKQPKPETPNATENKPKKSKTEKIRKVVTGIFGKGGKNATGTSSKGFLHPKVSSTSSPPSGKGAKRTSGVSPVPVISKKKS